MPAAPGDPPTKITFTLGDVINPESVQQVDGLRVVIYAEEGKYAIDEFEGYIGWTLEQGKFIAAQVKPSSPIAYDEDISYEISFTPVHMIPMNGYIEIDFPMQVSVPDYSYSQSSCRALENTGFSTN